MINIASIDRNQDGGVVVVHWTASKTIEDFTASSYGTEGFTPDSDAEGYTQYEDLTVDQVVGWFDAEKVEAIESALNASIEAQKATQIISGLPWAAKEEAI
jgi:hypothetical protein